MRQRSRRAPEILVFAARNPRYTCKIVPVVVSLLRAVNVGGHAVVKMAELRALYESLRFEKVQTYVQSGNVIFETGETDLGRIAARIRAAIKKKFAVEPDVIVRTVSAMRDIVARNPFARRKGIEPNKLHVQFLPGKLSAQASAELKALPLAPEELVPSGQEIFIYFPDGAGKSKLPWPKLQKICGMPGTGRNWNSVTKLLAIAEAVESAD
ncbi:MAG TPA: DUF1697 domain-containing protein [Candidatus Acidoferrum sp.]|nr:DUF1697 domain-containing protein [Candidatus Acidoferrum sp.]